MSNSKRRLILEIASQNKTKAGLSSVSGDIRRFSSSIKRMAVGMAAAAGVYGLGSLIKQTMASIDVTAKLSDRLGMSTEKLIGLQHGASIAGVDTAKLNKALEVFSRRLGEVKMGTGEAERALEAMGLSADELIKKSPSEALGLVSDRMNEMGSQAQKAAAANFLFGRAGQQLMNLFAEGSAGLARYQEEVERLNVTYSRVDAAQVEAMNDALYEMKRAGEGLIQEVVIQMAPYLDAIATSMTEIMASEKGHVAVVKAFESMAVGAISFANAIEIVGVKVNVVLGGLKASIADIIDAYVMLDKMNLTGLITPALNWAYGVDPEAYAAELQASGQAQMALGIQQENALKGRKPAAEKFFESLIKKRDALVEKYEREKVPLPGVLGWREEIFKMALADRTPLDENLANSLDSTLLSMQSQAEAFRRMNLEGDKNIQITQFRIKAEEAYGETSSVVAKKVAEYAEALEKVEAVKSGEKLAQMVSSMRDQIAVIDRVNSGQAESLQIAQIQMQAEQAFGKNTASAKQYADDYAASLKQLAASQEAQAAAAEAAEAKQQNIKAVESLVSSMRDQTIALDMVNSGRAKSIELAEFMLQAERAYGEGATEVTEMVKQYGESLDTLTLARERQARAEKLAVDRVNASNRVNEILDGMRRELDMTGKIGESWERSREYAELHTAAMQAAAGEAERYRSVMAEAGRLFEQQRFAEKTRDYASSLETTLSGAINSLSEDWRNYGDVAKSVLRDVFQEAMRIYLVRDMAKGLAGGISGFVGGLFGGGGGLFGGGGGGAATGNLAGLATGNHVMHGGGIVGKGNVAMRLDNIAAYARAPRRHSGLRAGEYRTILKQNEHVLTPRQMNAVIGTAASGTASNVEVNIHNNGTQKKVTRQSRRSEMGREIIDLWVQDYTSGGSTYRTLNG